MHSLRKNPAILHSTYCGGLLTGRNASMHLPLVRRERIYPFRKVRIHLWTVEWYYASLIRIHAKTPYMLLPELDLFAILKEVMKYAASKQKAAPASEL